MPEANQPTIYSNAVYTSAAKTTPVTKRKLNKPTTESLNNITVSKDVVRPVSTNYRPPTAIGFKNEIANVEGKEVKILKSKASEDVLATINSIEKQ